MTFTLLLFDSGICLPFKKGNEANLKNQKSNHEKSKLSENTFRTVPEQKNHQYLYKKTHNVLYSEKIIKTY